MPSYPANLPLPDQGSYGGSVDSGVIRTNVFASEARQRKTFNSPRVEIGLTFSMTNDDYNVWRPWVRDNAYAFFDMPVISPDVPTDITSTQNLRFISDISYQKRGDNWLSVSVTAELIPGDD